MIEFRSPIPTMVEPDADVPFSSIDPQESQIVQDAMSNSRRRDAPIQVSITCELREPDSRFLDFEPGALTGADINASPGHLLVLTTPPSFKKTFAEFATTIDKSEIEE